MFVMCLILFVAAKVRRQYDKITPQKLKNAYTQALP